MPCNLRHFLPLLKNKDAIFSVVLNKVLGSCIGPGLKAGEGSSDIKRAAWRISHSGGDLGLNSASADPSDLQYSRISQRWEIASLHYKLQHRSIDVEEDGRIDYV